MRVLLIHNDNLPFYLEDCPADIFVQEFKVSQASVSTEDFDTFLSSQVEALNKLEDSEGNIFQADLIILPYSLSSVNPAELTGIRLAAHVRLDGKDSPFRCLPILFLGPNSLEENLRLSDLAGFLLTPKVFTISSNNQNDLVSWIALHSSELSPLTEFEFGRFLKRFSVNPPSNLNDSHHSVTNRWALFRWVDMFDWGNRQPLLDRSTLEFSNSLYYKYLRASLKRDPFRRRNKSIPAIKGIEGMKIAYIDDEAYLGWGNVLEEIASNSKASLVSYDDFSTSYTREQLIERIKLFVDDNFDADCFVLDLRLHEEDHTNPDHTLFSGHQIAKHIYGKNHGAQIVIFTASEKVRNYVASEEYFSEYVMKEKPKDLLDREQSKALFLRFAHALQNARKNSYLKDYYSICKDVPFLDDFFELLKDLSDENLPSRSSIVIKRSAALSLIVYLESFIKKHFSIEGNNLFKDSVKIKEVHDACIATDISTRPYTPVKFGVHPGFMPLSDSNTKWERIVENKNKDGNQSITDIGLICASLFSIPGVSVDNINKVIDLKNIRNKSLAHGETYVDIELDLLKDVFDNIIKKLL